MQASDLLQSAYMMAMTNGSDLLRRWIKVSHRLAGTVGVAHLGPLEQNNRLDLLLRQLEVERLERLKLPPSDRMDWSFDVQSSLSQVWVLRAYEVMRVAKTRFRDNGDEADTKVAALARRLALVRMPIAKG